MRQTILPLLLITICVGLMGCGDDNKGPIEKTGETIDKAAEKTGEVIKEGAHKTGEVIKEGGEKVKDAVK